MSFRYSHEQWSRRDGEQQDLERANKSCSLWWLVDLDSRVPVWLQLAWLWCKRLVGR